ncbi:MAG: hypothetical protein PHS18_09500, partial [Sphaerochaetaceae bacterium]|nr:hypothetical protein [Sphaerochaetaceae bacterium]
AVIGYSIHLLSVHNVQHVFATMNVSFSGEKARLMPFEMAWICHDIHDSNINPDREERRETVLQR